MSETVQDHPDIEKLPLEVDGVAVREVVRGVFRDPDNGTPDNISKAGCLALARNGKGVWNAWREIFPTHQRSNKNYVNFSNVDFQEDENSHISFENFYFGNDADFSHSTIGGNTSFRKARFGRKANFSHTKFKSAGNFLAAQFWIEANFSEARFFEDANFCGAQFSHKAVFIKTTFWKNADFSGLSFLEAKSLYLNSSEFEAAKHWADEKAISPQTFSDISFGACIFQGDANFSDRKFQSETTFKLAEFTVPPMFYGCAFHQNTSFEDAKYPSPKGDRTFARAYSTLKLAFSELQLTKEEHLFFRLEMAEETRASKWYEKPYYYGYKCLSNYGHSIFRPFLFGLAVMLISAGLYAEPCEEVCLLISSHCTTNWDLIGRSLFQSVPLGGLVELKDNTYGFLRSAGIVLHKAASLLALFLMGLGFRNLFKLK